MSGQPGLFAERLATNQIFTLLSKKFVLVDLLIKRHAGVLL